MVVGHVTITSHRLMIFLHMLEVPLHMLDIVG